jgi:hypothetical protein
LYTKRKTPFFLLSNSIFFEILIFLVKKIFIHLNC